MSVENLVFNVSCWNDNLFVISTLGLNIGDVSSYDEVEEFIEDFCEDNDIDLCTISIYEN